MFNLGLRRHLSLALVLGLGMVLISSQGMASFENSTAVGLKEKEKTFDLFNNLSYWVTSDALDNNDQKVFNQGISYGGTLFIKNQFYVNLGAAATYHTVDNALIESDNGAFHFSDLSAGLGTKAIRLYKGSVDQIAMFANLRNVFPLSERSRNEGYKSVPSSSVDFAYMQGPFGFVLSGNYTYVVNSFETNTAGLYNLQSSTSGGLTARYNWWRFRFQYSYRLGVLNYMDNSNRGRSGNRFAITGSITPRVWASISTSNFSNVDEQFVDVWFYDPYSRFYNFSTGVTF